MCDNIHKGELAVSDYIYSPHSLSQRPVHQGGKKARMGGARLPLELHGGLLLLCRRYRLTSQAA